MVFTIFTEIALQLKLEIKFKSFIITTRVEFSRLVIDHALTVFMQMYRRTLQVKNISLRSSLFLKTRRIISHRCCWLIHSERCVRGKGFLNVTCIHLIRQTLFFYNRLIRSFNALWLQLFSFFSYHLNRFFWLEDQAFLVNGFIDILWNLLSMIWFYQTWLKILVFR